MLVKIKHALPDVRDLQTSRNGCYLNLPFRQPHDQKKRREWFIALLAWRCGLNYSSSAVLGVLLIALVVVLVKMAVL